MVFARKRKPRRPSAKLKDTVPSGQRQPRTLKREATAAALSVFAGGTAAVEVNDVDVETEPAVAAVTAPAVVALPAAPSPSKALKKSLLKDTVIDFVGASRTKVAIVTSMAQVV